jgi:hypothetical protein
VVPRGGVQALTSPDSTRHPEHDAVGREVRSWYTSSVPELGLEVATHWFGTTSMIGANQARAVLNFDDPAQVPAALSAVREACTASSFLILVDDRDRSARLDAALRQHGCAYEYSTTYLALTGPFISPAPEPDGLAVTGIGASGLETWARVKAQSFADTEDDPAPEEIAAEVARRLDELPVSEYQLGTQGGEPVAVLAHYPGDDDLVYILGTRVPYRHRGIAQAMLARWVTASAGSRSLMINATDGGAPAALYRRLGFTDEVYWYSKFEFNPS